VAITGVSGSGKSTLLHDVLYQALSAAKNSRPVPSLFTPYWDSVEGAEYLDEVVLVDQSPIGRTPRSNPVTYIKAFDGIRDFSLRCPRRKSEGSPRGIFRSTFPAGAVRPARGTARSQWKCSSWPMWS